MVWWILGLSAAYAVALNGTVVMPLVVLSISKLAGYDEGLATIVASAELAGIAIYGIFFPRLARRSWKAVASAGLLAVIIGEAASFYLNAPGPLASARLVTGLGEGAIFSVVSINLASLADAERLWGALSLIGGVAMGALLFFVSLLPDNQIGAAVFWMLAGFAAVMAPLFLLIGKRSRKLATAPHHSRLGRAKMLQAMIVVFLVYAVQAAQWALCGYVGERLRMSNGEIGFYLAASSLVGFFGAVVPSMTRDKAKRLPAVLIGFLIMAVSIYCFFNIFTPVVFVTAQVFVNIGFYIATPFITGILTENDPDGSIMSRTLVIAIVGAASGTAVAGPIFESAGAAAFGWSCLLPLALAAVFGSVVFGHLHRNIRLLPDAEAVEQNI
ncbi:MFS transporter [Bradyrhizobium manausense]|uniref:MFS transporter n=1 Tax=Bradyrhizobium manausense TaxID=989370 RepID=UPI001BAA078B|nr:MFS transporter [Bradyrhizobium manausense]MBR0834260.1 MFS transporter [Bradyrhizobium manausense]